VFVVDDFAAWLVGLFANVGRKRLTTLVAGTDQERELRSAVAAAVVATASELRPEGGEQVTELARVVSEVFDGPMPNAPLVGHETLLEALQAGIARQLAPLDDPDLTETGKSSADVLGVQSVVLTDTLFRQLVREIVVRGASGGPLTPLAGQLNNDLTHLQGQRLEGMVGQLASTVRDALARPDDAQTAAGGPAAPGHLLRPRPDNLPLETAEFVGRSVELGLLIREPGDAPRVTVIEGMPGVGKTALVVHAARVASAQYPDGALYLNFHTHDPGCPSLDAAEALRLLLQMLNVPATQIPDGLAERAAVWRTLLSLLRAVVILDDAARLEQIGPLLPTGDGRSLVLITSRYRIPGLTGARALTLDVLPVDDAITLFRQTAGASRAQDDQQVAAAVELCGRLPLAIQVTAARLARDSPYQLGDLLAELSRPPALVVAASASLEWVPAFDLSYRALEPGYQQFFRRLGLSPCAQISPHAAAALGGGALAEAEEAIAVLLDHHLLTRATGGQFRLHDLVRGYAAMCAARDDSASVHRQALGRLFDYYLTAADEADRVLYPFRRRMPVSVTRPPAATPGVATQAEAAAWLEAEWRNVLQAAQYAARHEWKRTCADLIHALAGFVRVRAYWDEAIAAQTLALQACRDIADPPRIAQALLELCEVSQETGRHEETLPLAEEAASIYRSQADRRGEAQALDQIGMANARVTRYREALAYFREARIMYQGVGDQHGVADTLAHAGIACWHLGRHSDATDHLAGALSRYREAGDRRGEAKTLNDLGRIHLRSGYHRDALEAYQDSLKIFAEIGGAQNEAILYQDIGGVYAYKGSHDQALNAYHRALIIYREIGDLPNQADVLNDIGTTYRKVDYYDEALMHHEQAGLVAEEIGNQSQQVIAMRGIADVSRAWGRYDEAIDQYHKVLKLAREIGDPYEEAKILEGIAEATLSSRGPDAARILFRQALDIFERIGTAGAESMRIRIESLDPALGGPARR
jgi:tetratricopeptide (TPR) repeat protein